MRRLGEVEAKLVEVLLKTACSFVFSNPAVATLSGELAGWATQGFTQRQKREIRNVKNELRNLVDSIGETIIKQYGQEFRDLADHECAAALFAVAATFDDDSVYDVAKTDLTVKGLLRCLRRRRRKVIAAERLSSDAVELYDLVLKWTCEQLVSLLGEIPGVRTEAFGEILTRLRTIVEQLDSPERLYAKVKKSNDTQFTKFYRERAPRALEKIDLHSGLLDTRRYPLDEAYLIPKALRSDTPQGVTSAYEALAGATRICITAPPGGGKTTLAKRLFRLAARQAFGAALSDLNTRIPFYVSLRFHGGLPPLSEFLRPVLTTWVDDAPKGWVTRQLKNGRGLIIANAADELPAAVRTQELDRFADFAAEQSELGNIVILTSRRAALPAGWTEKSGFREIELLPLAQEDIVPFVYRWHEAAMIASADVHDHARIARRRDELLQALSRNSHLRLLATNPLCCALLCALHVDRSLVLPRDWLMLIDLVLKALAERDTEREVPEPSVLASDSLLAVERDFAYWVMINGPTPVSLAQAENRIRRLLPSLGIAEADAELVVRDLVCRSSLLHTLSDGRVEFANSILRDHLAAGEFVSANDIGLLRRKARNPERHRLVVAAAGRARGTVLYELVNGLLEDAEAHPSHAEWLRLVARAAMTAVPPGEEPDLAQRVNSGPPLPSSSPEDHHHDDRTHVCELMLDLLPDIADMDDESAREVVSVALRLTETVGTAALSGLARYAADSRVAIQEMLWHAWPRFDRIHYARVVLSACSWRPAHILITDGEIDAVQLAGQAELAVNTQSPDDVTSAEPLPKGGAVTSGPLEGSGG